MKNLIAICGDIHWSQYSSIVRRRGEKYSMFLEYLINSINWFNELATSLGCQSEIFLGDFFDKPILNAEEITALNDINWPKEMPKYFICGNHEMASVNHKVSSAWYFNVIENAHVISTPTIINIANKELAMLPYILETERQPLDTYFTPKTTSRVLLSHNDISGISMGRFISENGFTVEELSTQTDLCFNGHLHNGAKVANNVINVGDLCGLNFGEDATVYSHLVYVLDLETMTFSAYENPYALNFYKLDATINPNALSKITKENAVVTFKCYETDLTNYKKIIANNPNIIESRVIMAASVMDDSLSEDHRQEDLTIDHLQAFKDYVLANFEHSKELEEELKEVIS